MTSRVVLDLGCCPAGSSPERTVRGAGGKAAVVTAHGPDVSASRCDSGSRSDVGDVGDSGVVPVAWGWRVAGLLGMHREAVVAGCPVPLAAQVTTWAAVAEELAADRWDLVVLRVAPGAAGRLLEAPEVLLRVLDARLDGLAAAVAADPGVAVEVEALLELRPLLLPLRATARGTAAVGSPRQHGDHGCPRPGALAVAGVDARDPLGSPRPVTGVDADGDGFVWWLELPPGQVPLLHREDDRLLVETAGQRRTLSLPAALARCTTRAATVVGDRLEVRFAPDPGAWR